MDAALDLEEQHIEQGRQDGLIQGRKLGREEGRQLGLQKGFEIGHELGFYTGCTQLWRQNQQKNSTFINARADKAITALEEQLKLFPMDNPKDERLHDLMDSIRGKYKAAVAMLGLTEAYMEQQSGNSGGGLQF